MTTSPYDNLPVGNRPFNISDAGENTTANTVENSTKNTLEDKTPVSSDQTDGSRNRPKSSQAKITGYEEVILPDMPDTVDTAQSTEKSLLEADDISPSSDAADTSDDTYDIQGESIKTTTPDKSKTEPSPNISHCNLAVHKASETYSPAIPPINSSKTTISDKPSISGKTVNPSKTDPLTPSANPSGTSFKPRSAPLSQTEPMTKSPRYSKTSIQNRCTAKEFILPFEESLIVPDTMPDMQEIFFTEGHISLAQNKSSYEPADILSGEVTLYTVYRPDSDAESPVDAVKSSIAVKTSKCWGDSESSVFKVSAFLKSSSAEMINERKFIARGEVCLTITEIQRKELNVFKDIDDPNLIKQEAAVSATGLSFETEEITDITREIKIGDDQPSPAKILKSSISITEAHKQVASGRLVVNAIVKTDILYTGSHDGETKLCHITDKTDFTQFISLKNEPDISLIKTFFNGDNLDIIVNDNSGFTLKGQVRTSVRSYENKKIPIISDAYHKEKDLEFDVSETPLFSVTTTSTGDISAREIISTENSKDKPDRLICSSLQPGNISCHPEGSRIVIEGQIPIKILAMTEEGKPFIINGLIPLRGAIDADISDTPFHTDLWTAVKDMWIDNINSRQIEINLTLSVKVWINMQQQFSTLENLHFTKNQDAGKRVSMAVYVTGKGDTLWSIGKKYKGDMDAIARFNQIDPSHPLTEGTKLLITK